MQSWLEEILTATTNVVGSLRRAKPSISKEIDQLAERLSKSENIAALANHRGWIETSEILIKTATDIDRKIISLAAQARDKAPEIEKLAAYSNSLKAVVGTINSLTKNQELLAKKIREKQIILEERPVETGPAFGGTTV